MNGIDRFRDTATGPRRLRQELRRKTAGVRVLMASVDAIAGVRAMVPLEVLGAGFFALLSGRLQAVLWEQQRAGDASRPRAPWRPRWPDLTEPAARTAGPIDVPDRQAPAPPSRTRHDPPPASERVSFVDVGEATADRASPPPRVPEAADGRAAADLATGRDAPAQRRDWEAAALAPEPPRGRPVGASLLAAKLGEYERLSRQPPAADPARPGWPPSTGGNGGAAIQPPAWWAMLAEPVGRSWPEPAGDPVASRLRGFAGRADGLTAPGRPAPVDAGAGLEIHNVFNIDVRDAAGASADDLPERIADILREQAARHGIDLT